MNEIKLFEGAVAVDDRGRLSFVNGFDFCGVKRFYAVENHRQGFIRAWHGHKNEAKYVYAARGSAIVGAVKIDDFANPSASLVPSRYVLSADKPSILYIPAGHANGFMSLSDDLLLMFFSTSSLEESKGDDYRYDARFWDIWQIVER
jgi:dTDP-4-dehydrorhamnose 3,5-epimerase-like enzyme